MRLDDSSLFKFWAFNGGEVGCRFFPDAIKPRTDLSTLAVRMNQPDSLVKLILAHNAIRHSFGSAMSPLTLNLGYMPYARQDKIHEPGDAFALEAVADVIDNLGFDSIMLLDPHSETVNSVFSTELEICDGRTYASNFMSHLKLRYNSNICIVIPDKGATRRCSMWGAACGVKNFIQVEKERDKATGKILGFKLPADMKLDYKAYVILDDICDKGGTFVGIAQEFNKAGVKTPLHLYTSHGIYPGDTLETLSEYFTTIGTTNTWKDFDLVTQEKTNLFVQEWF